MCVSVCLHQSVSICLSICVSVCLCVCLSVYLPASLSTRVQHYIVSELSGLKFTIEACRVLSLRLTWPAHNPTTKSAINVSSVSPLRWLTITPQPLSWASLHLRKRRESETTNKQHVFTFVEMSLPFTIKLGFNWQSHQATRRTVMAPTSLTVFPSTGPLPLLHILLTPPSNITI